MSTLWWRGIFSNFLPPLIAITWLGQLDQIWQLDFSYWVYSTLFLVTSLVYILDRWLDACFPSRVEVLQVRHLFYRQNSRLTKFVVIIFSGLLVVCLYFISDRLILVGSIGGVLILVYFGLIYGGLRWLWIKQLMGGVLFAYGSSLAMLEKLGDLSIDKHSLLMGFSALCVFNIWVIHFVEAGLVGKKLKERRGIRKEGFLGFLMFSVILLSVFQHIWIENQAMNVGYGTLVLGGGIMVGIIFLGIKKNISIIADVAILGAMWLSQILF